MIINENKIAAAPTKAQTAIEPVNPHRAIMDDICAKASSNDSTDTAAKAKEKTEAERLFDRIGTGKAQAVRVSNRDTNNRISRAFRRLVAEANKEGDCIINLGDGKGYYRPDPSDPEELNELAHYISSLDSRARQLTQTVAALSYAENAMRAEAAEATVAGHEIRRYHCTGRACRDWQPSYDACERF